MDMVWTLGKDPLVQKPDHDEGEWMEERKIFSGCACDKSQRRTSERPHRNILQRFNWSILEEERDIRAAEAFILICAWLRRVGGWRANQIKRSSKRYQKMAFCNIFVGLQAFPGFIFIAKPQKTVGSSLLKQQKFQNSCHTFHMFKSRAWQKRCSSLNFPKCL